MPLIGSSPARKKRKGTLARASRVKNNPAIISDGSPLDEPDVDEVIPLEGFFDSERTRSTSFTVTKKAVIASPADWETAVDLAAGSDYDLIETIEQPAENIVQGMAISDLAEIEERDLTCCLCLKRIDPEEVNYAKYYSLLQLMEEKIIKLRKENRKLKGELEGKKRGKKSGRKSNNSNKDLREYFDTKKYQH